MLTNNIYTPTPESVNIKPYKFRRLNRDKAFWTAWTTGSLDDKSRTKVLYKLASAMRWARFTKPEVLHMLKSWHRTHGWRYDPAQLELIYIAVDHWLKPKIRLRKRLEMQRYRERQRQRKTMEAFEDQVAGGGHD
jgi:hypothetical protein